MAKGSKRNRNMAPDTNTSMKGQTKQKPGLPKKDRSIGTDGSVYRKGSNVRDC